MPQGRAGSQTIGGRLAVLDRALSIVDVLRSQGSFAAHT